MRLVEVGQEPTVAFGKGFASVCSDYTDHSELPSFLFLSKPMLDLAADPVLLYR